MFRPWPFQAMSIELNSMHSNLYQGSVLTGTGTDLSSERPGGEHVAAGVELRRFHLGVAGAAVGWHAVHLGGALKHLHVVHDGLVARGDHRLVLQEQRGRGTPCGSYTQML